MPKQNFWQKNIWVQRSFQPTNILGKKNVSVQIYTFIIKSCRLKRCWCTKIQAPKIWFKKNYDKVPSPKKFLGQNQMTEANK